MKRKLIVPLLMFGIASAARVDAAPILNVANGHYYDFINTGVDFSTALTLASGSAYLGYQGTSSLSPAPANRHS